MNRKGSPRSFSGPATLVYAVGFLLFTISALGQQSLQVLHNHLRPAVSSGQAALVVPLPSTLQISVSIVLPLRNEAQLDLLLNQLYDPSSPNYRKFLSAQKFTDQFGPTVEDYQAVVNFAQANGFTVTSTPASRMIVPISGSVAQIESAFNVKMNLYQHPTENRLFFSPDREPSLNLTVPIRHIAGLNNFSIPRPALVHGQLTESTTGSGYAGSFLPSDMRAAYYGSGPLTGSGQCVGLVEFGGYNINDVANTFDGAATASTSGSNYNLSYTTGGVNYQIGINNEPLDGATVGTYNSDEVEVALDIAQAIGMAPGLQNVRVYFAPDSWTTVVIGGIQYTFPVNSNDTLIYDTMASDPNGLCRQLSQSWLWEPEDLSTNDGTFKKMAADGQSFFTASGDYGAFDKSVYPYFYPAEDAYVTAVGGTDLSTTGPGGSWVNESARYRSSGGISPDGIQIPSWQTGVANSLNGGSTTLRNVPDVSMEANTDNYFCTMNVCYPNINYPNTAEGGTSYAAPRWAGFMALINQQAASSGDAAVGFINPYIYSIGEGGSYSSDIHDIPQGEGNNDCCGQPTWFSVEDGYDLVTGWGSPNGSNLVNALAPSTPPPPPPPPISGTISTAIGKSICESFYLAKLGVSVPCAPAGVAVDRSGNIYFVDHGNANVFKLTASTGVLTLVAGSTTNGYSGDGGPAVGAQLSDPNGLAIDASGNLYIADVGNYCIRKVTASTGIITTVAGNGTQGYSGDGGSATNAELGGANMVAVDASANLYISDGGNSRVRKVTASTGIISTVAGNGTTTYTGDGGLAINAGLPALYGMAFDPSGNLYLSDFYAIRKVAASTGIITTVVGNWSQPGYSGDGGQATNAEINMAYDIAFDASGNMYITDMANYRIRMVAASTGIIYTFAGNGTSGDSGDGGPATGATLNLPTSIALDVSGNVYFSEQNNDVRKVTVQ